MCVFFFPPQVGHVLYHDSDGKQVTVGSSMEASDVIMVVTYIFYFSLPFQPCGIFLLRLKLLPQNYNVHYNMGYV